MIWLSHTLATRPFPRLKLLLVQDHDLLGDRRIWTRGSRDEQAGTSRVSNRRLSRAGRAGGAHSENQDGSCPRRAGRKGKLLWGASWKCLRTVTQTCRKSTRRVWYYEDTTPERDCSSRHSRRWQAAAEERRRYISIDLRKHLNHITIRH